MFDNEKRAYVAISGTNEICMLPEKANRHGLITSATGTGKTVTLQTLAETFSAMGVPVFAADVKGDLSGVAHKGGNKAIGSVATAFLAPLGRELAKSLFGKKKKK